VNEPLPYVVAHLHEALMADARLNEQAIEIVIVGSRLELRGEVATPERRAAALAVVHELAPGIDVVDDLRVSRTTRRDDAEPL
jgi:hypothetical protein